MLPWQACECHVILIKPAPPCSSFSAHTEDIKITMKFLLSTSICLMLTLVLVYGTPTKRKTTNMLFLQSRSKENYSRQKRSCTSDCATASGVIDSSSFSQCVTKFNQILDPDAQPLTISDGQNFCSGHCDTNTVKALDDIEACCGEDPVRLPYGWFICNVRYFIVSKNFC
jgi:hypothetical protein